MTVNISKTSASIKANLLPALDASERRAARRAITAGRRLDKLHFEDHGGEWFVRRSGPREFRGMMEACGYQELPFNFPKWPDGVVISRRCGRLIERWFAGVHESAFAENEPRHVLGAYTSQGW